MTTARSTRLETLDETRSIPRPESEFRALVVTVLRESDEARRKVLADNAWWFAANTVGACDEDAEHATLSAEIIEGLLSDAEVIFNDGIEDGDIEQAADAVSLGAGLLTLVERYGQRCNGLVRGNRDEVGRSDTGENAAALIGQEAGRIIAA